MPSDGSILASLTVILVVTFALRALPFVIIEPLRSSAYVSFLGRYMPVGVMLVLVVYTLRDVSFTGPSHGIPEALALLVTVVVHLWWRNALLSIVAGTGLYVLLVGTVFA